jgi:hypothetical protein
MLVNFPTFLTVAVVSPAVDLSVLQDGHAAGLAAGDPHHFPAAKRGAHFPAEYLVLQEQ